MSDDLDLRGIDARYEPNPQFRAALRDRVAAIVDGADPDLMTESRDLVTVDLEPTNARSAPSRNRRLVAQVILAAAAVVAIAVVASRDDSATPADQPSPTVTAPPPPRALTALPDLELLAPGTYFVDEVDGTPTPRIFVTIGGTGWTNVDGSGIDMHGRLSAEHVDDDVGLVTFSRPDQVYLDACHLSEGFNPGQVRTLDGLVTALMEQQGGWVDVTVPSDISIDGYPGKTFQRTVPDVLSDCPNMTGHMRDPELDGNALRSWLNENEENIAGWYYEPGQVETLMVLDIDGTVVVINANLWAGSSAADRAEFADVLDSIRIASSPDDATPADQPSPTVTVPPTAPPRALSTAEQSPEQLVPGTYFADWFRGPETTMRIFVTVGAGWSTGPWNQQSLGLGLSKTGQGVGPGNQAGSLTFSHPGDDVFSDACHPSEGYTPADVATVDGLVDALTAQAGWAAVTTPSDISVDGYVGKAFQRTAPTDMSDCDTAGPGGLRDGTFGTHPDFRSWEWSMPYEPGQTETVWVLDFDGRVVVITTTPYPEASEAERADLASALDSIRIDAA